MTSASGTSRTSSASRAPVATHRRGGDLAALACVFALLLMPVPARANSVEGAWSEPFKLGVVGIHSVVLHTGEVLLFDYPGGRGTRAKLWDPGTGAITDVGLRRRRDLFCSGHTVLPDGRVLAAGGTRYGSDEEIGTRATDLFSPETRRWKKGPRMSEPRWYPSTVETPGGKVLIFSGQWNEDRVARSVESYDPASGEIERLPRRADHGMSIYPRLHLLPNGKLFRSGEDPNSLFFNPGAKQWRFVDFLEQEGGRYQGASVLLPGLNRVLTLGGTERRRATSTAEIIDFSASKPQWRLTASMAHARQHANAVLLPDGRILVVGGGLQGLYRSPTTQAELFDPATETWIPLASQRAPRMYHSTAVLLPDGRVLSAGQDKGEYQETGEVYSPPYLFRGPRPTVSSAPSQVGYGGRFAVDSPEATDVARVALIRPGSATHGVDFDQRYVDLEFERATGSLSVSGPESGRIAPPGWYMLFLVDGAGVPSVASWVHVGP